MLYFRGCDCFRLRILLSCLSGRPIRIDDIRADDDAPGLQEAEASLLRLTEKVSNGCVVEISETGTTLKFRPGIVVGATNTSHHCNRARAISYYLEPLMVMCLFAKKPLDMTLHGITNGATDLSMDAVRACSLPLIRATGADVRLSVRRRGVGHDGPGQVHVSLIPLKRIERPLVMTDEGLVRRVRGVAWTVNMAPHVATACFSAAKGVLLRLLADVTIFTDVVRLPTEPGKAKPASGYGICLVAETTAGRYLMAERCVSAGELKRCRTQQITPTDVGEEAACLLLDEVQRGGVTDGCHQPLLVTLAAIGPPELNKVRVGALTHKAVQALRHLNDFLGISFDVKSDADSSTLFLTCIGAGLKNISRKVQ